MDEITQHKNLELVNLLESFFLEVVDDSQELLSYGDYPCAIHIIELEASLVRACEGLLAPFKNIPECCVRMSVRAAREVLASLEN